MYSRIFFSYLSSFENERDGKESGDMYERCASFNRYGDLSKFITDPDLLQATGDGGVYISNEDNYDIAVYLETCYASFDEVKPFIVFLATQICELDNAVQRFHRKKELKNGRGYVRLPSSLGTLSIDYSQSMEDNPTPQEEKSDFILAYIYMEEKTRSASIIGVPQKIQSLMLFLNIKRINFSCGHTVRLTISPTAKRGNGLPADMESRNDNQRKENIYVR